MNDKEYREDIVKEYALEDELGNLDIPSLPMTNIIEILCDAFEESSPLAAFDLAMEYSTKLKAWSKDASITKTPRPPEGWSLCHRLILDLLDSALEHDLQIAAIRRALEIADELSALAEKSGPVEPNYQDQPKSEDDK